MRTPELKTFIRQHSTLFWYTPEDKKEEVSDELLVETILNYGTMESVVQLFNLLGIKKTSEIFKRTINLSERRQRNYNELTINYFTKFFEKHAH